MLTLFLSQHNLWSVYAASTERGPFYLEDLNEETKGSLFLA